MNEVLARIIARVTDRLAKDRDVEVLNSIDRPRPYTGYRLLEKTCCSSTSTR